jgi:ATP-dependent Clp protease ATP-binding subunit ClpA
MFEKFSQDARSTVTAAVEDAEKFHSEHVGVEHLLLGLLRHADSELRGVLVQAGLTPEILEHRLAETAGDRPLGSQDAAALRSIGIDLDAVIRNLEAAFGPEALQQTAAPKRRGFMALGRIPFNPAAKKALELSLREAIVHKDKTIQVAHLMLGILRAPDTAAKLMGGDAGVSRLRAEVTALLRRTA